MNRVAGALTILLLPCCLVMASERSIVRIGKDIEVRQNEVVKDAVAIGGNVAVEGAVTGNAVAVGGNLTLGDNAIVGGDAVAVGGRVLRSPTARVSGDETEVNIPLFMAILAPLAGVGWLGFLVAAKIAALVGFLLIAVLATILIPELFLRVASRITQKPVDCLLWGVLGIVLIAPLAIALIISIVGIVLIPLEFVFVGCAMLVGSIAIALVAGELIFSAIKKPQAGPVVTLLIGIIALWLIGLIPILGWLIKALLGVMALGAAIVSFRDWRRKKSNAESLPLQS